MPEELMNNYENWFVLKAIENLGNKAHNYANEFFKFTYLDKDISLKDVFRKQLIYLRY